MVEAEDKAEVKENIVRWIITYVFTIIACLVWSNLPDPYFWYLGYLYFMIGSTRLFYSWRAKGLLNNICYILFCVFNLVLLTNCLGSILKTKVSYGKFHLLFTFIYLPFFLLIFIKSKQVFRSAFGVLRTKQFEFKGVKNSKGKLRLAIISLLIWFSSAQGIYNRVILGPRDNQFMASYLFKESPKKINSYRIGAICSDGWHSSATGSGACSWHGGVKEWLYQTDTVYSKSYEECKIEAQEMNFFEYYFW